MSAYVILMIISSAAIINTEAKKGLLCTDSLLNKLYLFLRISWGFLRMASTARWWWHACSCLCLCYHHLQIPYPPLPVPFLLPYCLDRSLLNHQIFGQLHSANYRHLLSDRFMPGTGLGGWWRADLETDHYDLCDLTYSKKEAHTPISFSLSRTDKSHICVLL